MQATFLIVTWILGAAASDKVLPGAYYVGDSVVSEIDHKDGQNRVRRGDLGQVIGRGTVDHKYRIAVRFPDAPHVNILPDQVRRVTTVIQCTDKGRCYVKNGHVNRGGNTDSGYTKPRSDGTVHDGHARSWDSWQIVKYILAASVIASVALALRATVEPFFDRMEKKRDAEKKRKEKERDQKIAMRWVVEEDYCCGMCAEPLLDPVTMSCKHTVCKFCLQKWIATSQTHGSFACPVGACPHVRRVLPAVNEAIRDATEERFADRLQERREELAQERAEFEKVLCTQRLQEEIDASYVDKRAIDEDTVESLLENGASASVNSIKFSDDTLLKVVLNSLHLAEDDVYTCAKLLVDYGATGAAVGDLELDAFLPRWAASTKRDEWEALAHKAFGPLWESAIAKVIVGDFKVGDKVLVKSTMHLQDGSWLHAGSVGGVVGPGSTAERMLIAFNGARSVHMLPSEIETFSDERALALQEVAQEASRSAAAISHVHLAHSHNHAAQHIRAVAEQQFHGRLPDDMVRHFVNVFNMTEDAIRQIVPR